MEDKYKAQNEYHKRIGIKSVPFKLKVELADKFKEKCNKNKQTYASVISGFMEEYIKDSDTNE